MVLLVNDFRRRKHAQAKPQTFAFFETATSFSFVRSNRAPKDHWLDKLLEGAPPGQIVGGGRSDPIFNRLTTDIHSAVKQVEAVNPDQKWPNVLALVNHDNMCGFDDLIGTLTGNLYTNSGNAHPIYKQFSEGRIKDERGKIHLFLWLDDFKPLQSLFSQTNHECHIRLCELLGINSNDIIQIRS